VWPLRKSLDQIRDADLEELLGVRETQVLEFKEAMCQRKDAHADDCGVDRAGRHRAVVTGMIAVAEESR
jgi:hypothetical protein